MSLDIFLKGVTGERERERERDVPFFCKLEVEVKSFFFRCSVNFLGPFSTNGKDSKMSVMGSALMNMIRKNKKKDSPNQEEKKSRSSDSSSNEMFEKIYSELKSISKRLGDLEGRVDSGNSKADEKVKHHQHDETSTQ